MDCSPNFYLDLHTDLVFPHFASAEQAAELIPARFAAAIRAEAQAVA